MDKLVLNQSNISEQANLMIIESLKDIATPPPRI